VNRQTFVIYLATVGLIAGVLTLVGWATWVEMTPDAKDLVDRAAGAIGSTAVIGVVLAFAVIFITIHWMYRTYAMPLPAMAEDARMIAVSNPAHRPKQEGAPEVRDLAAGISLLAERYEVGLKDVADRIQEASAALADERDTLAALMAKLTQGVVVCNQEGRVLLYNRQAQRLLEGPARETGGGDWIGLGRSVYGLIDESLLRHALMTLVNARQRGEATMMAPFVASRPGGQLLNVHLVPITGTGRRWHGYILTFDDVPGRMTREARRVNVLLSLIEGQRTAVSSIRAAVEAIIAYPDMDEDGRRAFYKVIHDEVVRLSERFDGLEDAMARERDSGWPTQVALGSDLLAAIERHVEDVLEVHLDVTVPLEPLRLRADSYAIARCVIFLISQVRSFLRAESVSLSLEAGAGQAGVVLQWVGAPLHMEALRTWGMRNVLTDLRGASMTLFDVVERHSGAVWPLSADRDGRFGVRLLLPLADAAETGTAPAASPGAAPGGPETAPDFDFRLSASRGNAGTSPPLARLNYTVVDTETTGLGAASGDEIIAIGAVRLVNGRVLRRECFDTFVNPRVPISEQSRKIHHISADMLRGQPRIEDVMPNLARFLEDSVIVGHNVDFDMRFFSQCEDRTGVHLANHVLDTLRLEYVVNPNQEDRSLDGLAGRLGITVTGRHSALGDALTTAEVFLALLPLLEQHGITNLAEAQAASDATPFARKSF
jgi:DNA polymerase III subunit epsilon